MRRQAWLLGVGGGAFAVLCVATRFGIGVSTDSVAYIAEARQLVRGEGLTLPAGLLEIYADVDPARSALPSAHFPPLYPLVIAATGLAEGGASSFRWLNALLLAATAVVVAAMVSRHTGSRSTACLAAGMVVLAAPVLRVHSMAWSEPLYVALGFAGLLALAAFLEDGRRSMLVAGALGLGLAWLTRYVGIAFVLTGAVALLLGWARGRATGRQVAAFVGLSVVPMAAYLAGIAWSEAGGAGFTVAPDRPSSAELDVGVLALWDWFLPTRPSSIWFVLAWAPVVALLYVQLRLATTGREPAGRQERGLPQLPLVVGVYLVSSAVVLLASLFVFADYLPLEERFLVPLFVAAVALVACSAPRAVRKRARFREPVLVLLAALVTSTALGGVVTVGNGIRGFPGFAAREWRDGEVVDEIRSLPPSTRIYSNFPEAIYVVTGREARLLPKQRLAGDRIPRHLAARTARLRDDVRAGEGIVVYFIHAYRDLLPSPRELTALLGVQPRFGLPDCLVYETGARP
ncbi:MAG: phospholipid carrier-dependent glycosyltransferase [Actinomycetota bacterium]|nr:phospholipid carrier-dependent glycosyltransferase [Actinomycetota bacterium]